MDDATLNVVAPRLLETAAEWDQREAHRDKYKYAEAQTQRDLYFYLLGRERVMPPEWAPVLEHASETDNDPEWTLFQLLERKMRAKSGARPHKRARTELRHLPPPAPATTLLPDETHFQTTTTTMMTPPPPPHGESVRMRIVTPQSEEATRETAMKARRQQDSSRILTWPVYQEALERARLEEEEEEGEQQKEGAGRDDRMARIISDIQNLPACKRKNHRQGKKRKRKSDTPPQLPPPSPSDHVHPELRLQTPKIDQLQRLVNRRNRYPWMSRNVAFTTEAQRRRHGHTESYLAHTFRRQKERFR